FRCLETHLFRTELPPNCDDLAGLAGIGIQQMLKDRIRSLRNICGRNGDVFILHGHKRAPDFACILLCGWPRVNQNSFMCRSSLEMSSSWVDVCRWDAH